MLRNIPSLSLVVLIGLVVAVAAGAESVDDRTDRIGTVSIQILATTSTHGELEECGCKSGRKGGLARRVTIIDSLRAGIPNTLVVDAGNWGDRNPDTGRARSDFIFRAMTRMGYDAATPGPRELAWGVPHFEEMAGDGPEILISNLREKRGDDVVRIGTDFQVKELDGARVGTFGLIEPGLLDRTDTWSPDLRAEDVFTEAERVTALLEARGCELIVLLAQMEPTFVDSLVRRVPAIDVVVLGHTGVPRATHATIGETIIVRPGSRGQQLGRLEITLDDAGDVVEYGGRCIVLDGKIKKDPTMLAMIGEMKAELARVRKEAQLLEQTEYRNQQRTDRFLGAEVCARCHQVEYDQWAASGHADAWNTLVDLGMESSEECVSCHATGHGRETGFEHPEIKPDLTAVQCEACHDMGTLHRSDAKTELTSGLLADACAGCHDDANSPGFDARSYMERIRHW